MTDEQRDLIRMFYGEFARMQIDLVLASAREAGFDSTAETVESLSEYCKVFTQEVEAVAAQLREGGK